MILNIVFGDGSRDPYVLEGLTRNELADEMDKWSKEYYLTMISVPARKTETIVNMIAYDKRALNMPVNEDENV